MKTSTSFCGVGYGGRRSSSLLSRIALLGLVFTIVSASGQITEVPPFIGDHSETWEEFPYQAIASGTPIFGGIATISGEGMVTSFRFLMCIVVGKPIDGVTLMDTDRPAGLITISFTQPVSAFGGYWGSGVACYGDPPSILTFFDVDGNVVGTASIFYGGDGTLEWHGFVFDTPVKTITRIARDGEEGFAIDGLQAIVTPSVQNPARLRNISTRGFVQSGDNILIGGFIVSGSLPKEMLLRVLGPSLGQSPFNVANALADPTLELHSPDGSVITNDDWQFGIDASYIPEQLQPSESKEAAILKWLDPGSYTVVVRGVNQTTGNALVEAYDLDNIPATTLANLSTRGFVQSADNILIGGIIVGGSDSEEVVIRALGPSLADAPSDVANALTDPFLDLRDANGATIMTNDNWEDTQGAKIQASGLAPANSHESAIDLTLEPGNYTAIVTGVNGATGNALVEFFALK